MDMYVIQAPWYICCKSGKVAVKLYSGGAQCMDPDQNVPASLRLAKVCFSPPLSPSLHSNARGDESSSCRYSCNSRHWHCNSRHWQCNRLIQWQPNHKRYRFQHIASNKRLHTHIPINCLINCRQRHLAAHWHRIHHRHRRWGRYRPAHRRFGRLEMRPEPQKARTRPSDGSHATDVRSYAGVQGTHGADNAASAADTITGAPSERD